MPVFVSQRENGGGKLLEIPQRNKTKYKGWFEGPTETKVLQCIQIDSENNKTVLNPNLYFETNPSLLEAAIKGKMSLRVKCWQCWWKMETDSWELVILKNKKYLKCTIGPDVFCLIDTRITKNRG